MEEDNGSVPTSHGGDSYTSATREPSMVPEELVDGEHLECIDEVIALQDAQHSEQEALLI